MKTSVAEIAELVGGRVVGDGEVPITGVSGIRQAGPGDLTFVADPRYARHIDRSLAAAVLVGKTIARSSKPLIQVENPYQAFIVVVQQCHPCETHHPHGIAPSAVIGGNVRLGEGVALDAHTYVGDDSELGDGVVLYPGAYIGPGCRVGQGTVIYPNATIYERCTIGARCIIHGGVTVGGDGFGFEAVDGVHTKIPQVGTVEIGDDVEIGANSAIDRATFGSTVIGRGTKIDNLVQIGHNTEIGEHCIVCGNVGVSGSAVIGDHVTLAAGAGVAGHIEIGDGVQVGGGSGVAQSLEPGEIVSGYPVMPHRLWLRTRSLVKKLPELFKRVKRLEQRLGEEEAKERRNG